jgi:hypothetical protein
MPESFAHAAAGAEISFILFEQILNTFFQIGTSRYASGIRTAASASKMPTFTLRLILSGASKWYEQKRTRLLDGIHRYRACAVFNRGDRIHRLWIVDQSTCSTLVSQC